MGSLKLIVYGLLSEQSALLAIFSSQPVWQRLLLFLAGHLIASLLFAGLMSITFPKRFVRQRKAVLALFFCFNFFVPIFGIIGTVLVLFYFRKFQNQRERPEFFNVPLPPFMAESSAVAQGMGEGGAWTRLRTAGLPREQRLKALLAVGSSGGQNASRILQLATGDTDDEIRLLAFNLCERQEQKIQQTIAVSLSELKQLTNSVEKAAVCRNLAFSYWEMVYSALAQAELREFFVGQADRYAGMALEAGGQDPVLLLLLVRIHLHRRDFDLAERSVQQALEAGADPLKVIPYQAELAFHHRDFSAVKRLLGLDAGLRFKPGIGPVAGFWGGR